MTPFDYRRAASVDEAAAQLSAAARPLAGGTDLLPRLKVRLEAPEELVDIKRAGLPKGVEEREGVLVLGALTTLSEIEHSDLLKSRYALLAEAAAQAATPQLRNRATLGGNLLQRPRCWYYRNEHLSCWLKGGDDCPAKRGRNDYHALLGDGPCVAVHPSDLASCLLALDASVRLRGPGGERTLLLTDFYRLPEAGRRQETVIEDDELIVAVEVPALPEGTVSTYLKAMDRKVWAFALVGLAAVFRLEDGVVEDARLVLSGVAPIPWRLEAAERALAGQRLSDEHKRKLAELATEGMRPLEHNAYKVPLVRALVLHATERLTTV